MATKTSIATGKSSATGSWSDAKKPTEGDDVIISGFSIEWNSATRIRSLEVTATGTMSGGTTELLLGHSTAGPANVALKFAVGASITYTGNINYSGTFTTEAQTFETGGHAIKRLIMNEANTAKVKLLSDLSVTIEASAALVTIEGGTLELNGRKLTVLKTLEVRTAGTLDGLNGTVVATNTEGGNVIVLSAGTLLNGSSLTTEVTGTGEGQRVVDIGGKTIGTLTVSTRNVLVEMGAGGATVTTLNVNNKGAGVGKGLRLLKAQKLTVTGTISSNGTEAEPARLESSEAGVAAKLKVGEQELSSWMRLQDLAVETGVWYVPKGTDVSGNTEVGTTVKFEAKPAAAGNVLGMVV